MNKILTKRRDIMKKGILKSILIVVLLLIAGTVFALSGLLPKKNESKKTVEVKKEQVAVEKDESVTGKEAIGEKDIITKEIVIDDIEKMNVPVYEYVEKVIIDGKWGTGPSEFGTDFDYLGEGPIRPSSIAVDSKGNIYVLDLINNRIQKFDTDGKYLKSIPVESYADENGESAVKHIVGARFERITWPTKRGINIVIDSEDNLYYYMTCDHNTDNPKGEVWKFKNDEVVKKWEGLPVLKGSLNIPCKVEIDLDVTPYLGSDPYTVRNTDNYDFVNKKYFKRTKEFIKEKKNKRNQKSLSKAKRENITRIVSSNKTKGEYIIGENNDTVRLIIKDQIKEKVSMIKPTDNYIYMKIKESSGRFITYNVYEFNYEGKLLRILEGERNIPSLELLEAWMDIDKESGNLRVFKYELKKKSEIDRM